MNPFAEAFVRIRPDTTLFRQETQAKVGSALTGAGVGGLGARALIAPGAIGGLLLFAGAAKEAVGGAASLERELNTFRVVADASAGDMERVAEEAKALGADLTLPAVSSGDAARAFTELARGGLGVQDVLGGAKGVLQLAAAAEIDVAEAAQIAARALTTFRLPGEEAANVANLLVGAANAATGEVSDMALALSQAGAVASEAGLSIDQTVGAITLLAKNGILGSDAGTSLRTTLLRLIPTTKEAEEVTDALGIKIDQTRTLGEQLPEVLDQYKTALDRLNPVLRQQALETVFGTDAIRAMAIFAREGADGLAEVTAEASAAGQAQDVAAAKAEGLGGAWASLTSQTETLATSIGETALPPLTDFVQTLSDGVGAASDFVDALRGFEDSDAGKFKIVGDFTVSDLLGTSATDISGKIVEALDPIVNTVEGPAKTAGVRFAETFSFSAADALTGKGTTHTFADAVGEKFAIQAHQAGEQAGKALGSGVADGVVSAEQEAVNAARRTLREVISAGKDAVQEAIRQGAEAVRLSAVDARANLISIGQGLAGDALRLLEEGPLARRIEALQASLDRSQAGNERRRLTQELRDAERALGDAERQAVTAGPLTASQKAARERFLEPFRRDVGDAKAALGEFSTETVIGKLQEQAEAQKRIVQQGIADLIVQFNKGGLSLSQLNVSTAGLLARNGVDPYGVAGTRLGIAFKTKFEVQLAALRKQALEIATGLDVPQTGLEPTVVSPSGTRAEQNAQIRQAREDAAAREKAARDAVVRAQNSLRRATEEDTDATKDLAAAIRAAFKVTGSKKPSVATGPGSSPDRPGGRTP